MPALGGTPAPGEQATGGASGAEAMVNIGRLAEGAARGAPGRPALVIAGTTHTFGEFDASVCRVAGGLAANGVRRGARVALVDYGSLLATATILAAGRLGAAVTLMNPALTSAELAELVRTGDCGAVGVAGADAAPALRTAVAGPVLGSGDLLAGGTPPLRDVSGGGGDEALVLFTSGTTGLPKPVPITHDALWRRIGEYAVPFSPGSPSATSLMCVPMFHVGGSLGLLVNLFTGGTTVIQPRFDAGEWLRLVARHRVQSTFLVPMMLARILDHPEFSRTDLGSLTFLAYGAAAAPVELIRRAMDALPGVAFANVFGQTETLGAYTTLLPQDHRDPRRIGSVGRPLPGVEVRVVDVATGSDVVPGAVGELWVRAPQNVRPGWLQTGDLACCDADGYLYPAGRLSDTINRGGEKFGPVEIETVLRAYPGVRDAAVAGIPDPEMGERVGAAVVVRQPLSAEDIVAHCRSHLARFKVPERIAFVDALPYNATGEVSRAELARLIGAAIT